MNPMNERIPTRLITSAMAILFILTGCAVSHAEKADVSKVIFYVA